jgi:MFS family permease
VLLPGGNTVSHYAAATAAGRDAALAERAYAKVDRRIVPFLFLCYILAYLDRVNVSFAKLQMSRDLGLSDAAFATGAGIFFIGYFFFEVPSNLALKKFGARLWIARIMISWGAISAATMFVTGEPGFYAMRFALGLAEAGFFPGIIYYLTIWYPSQQRATRTAWFVSAVALAGVIGNPVSGIIMDQLSGALGLAGWQWLYLLEGLPSVAVGVCVIFYLDSSIQEASWLTQEEKAVLTGAIEREEKTKLEHRLIDAFKSWSVYLLSLIYFTLVIALYGITFWLPTIVAASGVTGYRDVGLITAIPYTVCAIGMPVISRNSDRTGERRLHYVLNMTAGAIGIALSGAFSSNPVLAIVFLSIGTLGVIGSMPLFWPMPSAFLTGTASAAGIGVINSIGNLGGYIGPNVPVWTKLVSAAPPAPLYVIAGIALSGAVLTLLFVPSSVNVKPRAE